MVVSSRPVRPASPERGGADGQPAAGEAQGRHVVVDAGRRGGSRARGRRPRRGPRARPTRLTVAPPPTTSSTSSSPMTARPTPSTVRRRGVWRWRAQSQQHDEDGGEVLEQEGHPDRQVGHRVEVGELAPGHAGQPVADDDPRVAAQGRPPAAQGEERRHEQHERGERDAQRHDGARRPACDEQRLGEGPGGREGCGRDERDRSPTTGWRGAA